MQTTFVVTEIEPIRLMIRDMPIEDRPISRLNHYGPESLSTTELIAAIIQTPDAVHLGLQLLKEAEGLQGLARASTNQLCRLHGMGPANAARLRAALELGRRYFVMSNGAKTQISSPAEAANLLALEMQDLEQEHLRLVLLDTKNNVIASPTLYVGNVNTSVIRVAEVFREAVRQNATSLIVAHNHPSGDPSPSPEDVRVTRQLNDAGKLMDIDLLDHLIIGKGRWVSMRERGLGFD